MSEDWYIVKGNSRYRGEGCHIIKAEIWVKASSIEEACEKVRKFLEPIADFEPMSCKWESN